MSILIVVLVCILPPFLLAGAWLFPAWRFILDGLAVLAAYVFGIISALSIYQILRDETVFMTNIHAVFQNNLFLLSGGYLGTYGMYRLQYHAWRQLRSG